MQLCLGSLQVAAAAAAAAGSQPGPHTVSASCTSNRAALFPHCGAGKGRVHVVGIKKSAAAAAAPAVTAAVKKAVQRTLQLLSVDGTEEERGSPPPYHATLHGTPHEHVSL